VIAHDVAIFRIVGQELAERRFAVCGIEAFDLERIADPVERGGSSAHRSAASVLHAADDLVDGVSRADATRFGNRVRPRYSSRHRIRLPSRSRVEAGGFERLPD
jgi:hypothetical protein